MLQQPINQHSSSKAENYPNLSAITAFVFPPSLKLIVFHISKAITTLHTFNGLFSRTTSVCWYQKDNTSLDLNEARDDAVLGCKCNGISWTIRKWSALCSREITTPTPHHSIFTGQILFQMPNQQCQSTEGTDTGSPGKWLSKCRWLIPLTASFTLVHTKFYHQTIPIFKALWIKNSLCYRLASLSIYCWKDGHKNKYNYVQGGPKKQTSLWVDNFAIVRDRKACDTSKVSKFCVEKRAKTKMLVKLNNLCILCINIQCIWNYAEFDNNA